jgi:hypothetical protein
MGTMIDFSWTGNYDRKQTLAITLAHRRLVLASFCYSPFWDGLLQDWLYVLHPRCTLRGAIDEFLNIILDLITAAERGECTRNTLNLAVECYQDLLDAYDLNDQAWNDRLAAVATTIDGTASIAIVGPRARQAV